MQHLQLSKSSYLEEICTARRKKNQLFQELSIKKGLKDNFQLIFDRMDKKLEELRDERQKLEELLNLEQSET